MTAVALHRVVRHETRAQAAVADMLRTGGHRYQAAVELEDATTALREAEAAGVATQTDRFRLAAAEAVWNALKIADWRVTV